MTVHWTYLLFENEKYMVGPQRIACSFLFISCQGPDELNETGQQMLNSIIISTNS